MYPVNSEKQKHEAQMRHSATNDSLVELKILSLYNDCLILCVDLSAVCQAGWG